MSAGWPPRGPARASGSCSRWAKPGCWPPSDSCSASLWGSQRRRSWPRASHLPVAAVLTRSLLTWSGLAVLAGGWALATALVSLVLLLPSARIADVLAVAAAAALALALTQPASGTLPALVAPLACATAGALIYRVAAVGLRGLERLSRAGPPVLRLALIGLARAPAAPALAIAFVAVSTGLGGFALGYRATLERGQADAAANRVPLDALVAPGPELRHSPRTGAAASLAGAGRRPRAAGAAHLRELCAQRSRGYGPGARRTRARSGSDPWLAGERRFGAAGRARPRSARAPGRSARRGPSSRPARGRSPWACRPAAARQWSRQTSAAPTGPCGRSPWAPRPVERQMVSVRVPAGRFELEALTLAPPTGLEITNGHQLAENPAAVDREPRRRCRSARCGSSGPGARPCRSAPGGPPGPRRTPAGHRDGCGSALAPPETRG